MPNSCDYNCTDLPAYEQVSCGEYRLGGFGGFAALDCDNVITDFSSSSEWTTEIEAGRARVFMNNTGLKGFFPEPSPVEGENPNACGAATIVDTYNRTVSWKDFNYNATNIAYYNALNRTQKWLVVYDCAGFITVIDTPVTFNVITVRPEANTEKQYFMITASWTAYDMPMEYEAPTGIFN